MGICQHCGHEFILKEGENVICPLCNRPPYKCWNCNHDIIGSLKECPVCKFYKCSHCNVCGKECKLNELVELTKSMDRRRIIEFIYNFKNGLERRSCPELVPISHAKTRLKTMALKVKGIRVRNKGDAEAFSERFNKIEKSPIGTTWDVSDVKEYGGYGIEWREVSYLAKCRGLVNFEIIEKEDKNGNIRELIKFTRTQQEPCKYDNWNKLVYKECPKCNFKTYDLNIQSCSNLTCLNKKGKEKGFPRRLKLKVDKQPYCLLARAKFKKHKEVKDGIKRSI